jgi:hypothetical protein
VVAAADEAADGAAGGVAAGGVAADAADTGESATRADTLPWAMLN